MLSFVPEKEQSLCSMFNLRWNDPGSWGLGLEGRRGSQCLTIFNPLPGACSWLVSGETHTPTAHFLGSCVVEDRYM